MKIVTTQEMRAAEAAGNAAGLSYPRMMESAGSAVAQEIAHIFAVQGRQVVVLAGPGNNGGDGLVAARYLHDARAAVTVVMAQTRPDSDANLRLVRERKIPVLLFSDAATPAELERLCGQADVIIDALLGTGARRPVGGALKAILDSVRTVLERRVENAPLLVAVDLPSGLDADSGEVDQATLPADITVTFAFPKRGHYLFPGAGYVGELVIADIGIPVETVQQVALDLADVATILRLLPRRPRDAHKGTFGKLLVVAGCANYTGAAYLSSMAAYRVGAGLVTLAVPQCIQPILAAKSSEVTFLPLAEAEQGYLGEAALPALIEALPGYNAVLIGCGLGTHPQTRALVRALLGELKRQPDKRVLIDADGLNALAENVQWPELLPSGCVLTPHPGEMARLSGLSGEQIAGDRVGVALSRAAAWRQVVLLKGAYTIIADPGGQATVNPFANAALATAGTGDVLAGVISGLLTQGAGAYSAAIAGAFLHGLAARIVTVQIGETGLIAGDLLPALPLAIRALREPPAEDEEEDA